MYEWWKYGRRILYLTGTASLTDSTLDYLVIMSEFTAVAVQQRRKGSHWLRHQSTKAACLRGLLVPEEYSSTYYPSHTSSPFVVNYQSLQSLRCLFFFFFIDPPWGWGILGLLISRENLTGQKGIKHVLWSLLPDIIYKIKQNICMTTAAISISCMVTRLFLWSECTTGKHEWQMILRQQ